MLNARTGFSKKLAFLVKGLASAYPLCKTFFSPEMCDVVASGFSCSMHNPLFDGGADDG